jgi:hypothetical protein
MTSNARFSFPAHSAVAVSAAALISAALLLISHNVAALDSAAQFDTAASLPNGAPAALSDGIEWSRVSLAPVSPGASVGAYDN